MKDKNWMNNAIKERAGEMYLELLDRKQSVVLIPAPDPRYTEHKIRVAENRPPEWFSNFCSKYPRTNGNKKYRKFRSKINRIAVLSALNQLKQGYARSTNAQRLKKFIKRNIENEIEEIPF